MRCWRWRAGWRCAVEARDSAEAIPPWPELPLTRRRRLAVLIGRLALRHLTPTVRPEPEVEAAHEDAVGGQDRPGAAGQGPGPPPCPAAHRLRPPVHAAAAGAAPRVDRAAVRARRAGLQP